MTLTPAPTPEAQPTTPAPVPDASPAETAPAQTTPTPDASTQAPAPEAKPEAPQGWKAALSREAKLQQERSALKAEQARLAEEAKQIAALKAAAAEAKKNPLKLLEAAGLTYDEVAAAQMAMAGIDPRVAELEQRLTSLQTQAEQEREAKARAEQEAAEAEEQRVLEEFQQTVTSHVTSASDKYPLINALAQPHLVVQEIEAHYAQTERVLTAEEAAAQVEAKLLETFPKDVEALLAIPKVREIVAAALNKLQPKEEPQQNPLLVPPRKALTNRLTPTTTAATAAPQTKPKPDDIWKQMLQSRGIA